MGNWQQLATATQIGCSAHTSRRKAQLQHELDRLRAQQGDHATDTSDSSPPELAETSPSSLYSQSGSGRANKRQRMSNGTSAADTPAGHPATGPQNFPTASPANSSRESTHRATPFGSQFLPAEVSSMNGLATLSRTIGDVTLDGPRIYACYTK